MKKTSVITLGTFDGVHRGHQALLTLVVRRARALNSRSVALAFDMPPRHISKRDRAPVLLSTLEEKKILFSDIGIDAADVLVFDRRTASMRPEAFFKDIICGRHRAVEMVVGPRLAFGRNREGNLSLLVRLGRSRGVRVRVVREVGGKAGISSTRIRNALLAGDVRRARQWLGYPYSVEGPVGHGDHRGRTLGFPTANLRPHRNKILPPGVFWVKVVGAKSVWPAPNELRRAADGVCNIGTRPTFKKRGVSPLSCEVHVFRGSLPHYGQRLRVVFMKRLRSERRFDSRDKLIRQIQVDLKMAKALAKKFSLHPRHDSL